MRAKIRRLLLLALNACDGLPMPESALASAVDLAMRPSEATQSDIQEALHDLDSEGLLTSVPATSTSERHWTLTVKGIARARQSR